MSFEPPVQQVSEIIQRVRSQQEEHGRRMASDPEYRAEHEAAQREHERVVSYFAEQAAREALRQREAALTERGVPRRLWRTLEAPNETPALTAIKAFVDPENAKTFLVLAGGIGTGKTAAASWPLLERHGKLVKAIELTRHGVYDTEFWDALRGAGLLVVDDLGTEPRDEKGWAASNFDALLDHRYDWQLKTILTTNLTADRFKEAYCSGSGTRALDRLRKAGTFVAIPGDSMRRGSGANQ